VRPLRDEAIDKVAGTEDGSRRLERVPMRRYLAVLEQMRGPQVCLPACLLALLRVSGLLSVCQPSVAPCDGRLVCSALQKPSLLAAAMDLWLGEWWGGNEDPAIEAARKAADSFEVR
jgi:hypothetical protein